MTPLHFIRVQLLAVTQAEIAAWCDVSPMAVSRWENGQRRPPLDQLRPILAAEAARRGLPWQDSWLFSLPACPECPNLPGTVCPGGCARLVAQCARIREGGGDHDAGLGCPAEAVTGNDGGRGTETLARQAAA